MFTLRTPEAEEFYQKQKALQDPNWCFLCAKDLLRQEFRHWFICENRYPYVRMNKKHDILATKRHVKELEELTQEETQELFSILYQINHQQIGKYHRISYNVPERQSCKFHFHLHLEVLLDD